MIPGIAGLRRGIVRVSSRLAWLPPAVARITVGWIFVRSGWTALNILHKVTEYFRGLGIPAPELLAPFVATVELVCGLLLLLGLLTRLASLPLIGTMLVAILAAKKGALHALSDLLALPEFLYIALCLWLGAYGPGPLSLDAWWRRRARRADAREESRPPARASGRGVRGDPEATRN